MFPGGGSYAGTGLRCLGRIVLVLALWWARVGTAKATPGVQDEAFRWKIVETRPPARTCGGKIIEIPLTLANVGSATWSRETHDRVSHHWLDETGAMIRYEGLRTELPRTVLPHQSVSVGARVELPDTPGRYQLVWAMVREGSTWYPPPVAGPARALIEVGDPAFLFEVEAAETPAPVPVGGRTQAKITLRNVGCESWSTEAGDRIAYQVFDREGRVVVRDGVRTMLPRNVSPGETVDVSATIVGPSVRGEQRLTWGVVRESEAWFRNRGHARTWPLVVEPAEFDWEYVGDALPTTLIRNEVVRVPVVVRNVGSTTWDPDWDDSLSYHWTDVFGRSVEFDGLRSELSSPVFPGESIEVDAQVRAPTQPGEYRLHWDLVRENVTWFGQRSPFVAVHVEDEGLAFEVVQLAAPSTWSVQRTDWIWVRVRNVGSRTWRLEDGDHLAYHWRDSEGEVVVWDGLRTNLPSDVAPGESVALSMRVRGPPRPGDFVLELAMVREHVRWFEPIGSPSSRTYRAKARSVANFALAAWCLGVLGIGLGRDRARRAHAWFQPAMWGAIVTGGLMVLVLAFWELSDISPWRNAPARALSGAMLLGVPAFALPARWAVRFGVLLLTVASAVVVIDLAYMEAFGSIVPLTAAAALRQAGDVIPSTASLLDRRVIVILVVPLLAAIGGARWRAPPCSRMHRGWIGLGCVLLGVPGGLGLATALGGHLGRKVYSERDIVGRWGVLGAHAFELGREISQVVADEGSSATRRNEVVRWVRARAATPRTDRPDFGLAAGANVLIIQVEALQRWVIGTRVGGREVTPFLNRWPDRALFFANVFDQTAQGVTSDAEYLALASQHPLDRGALVFLRPDRSFYTIAHVLAAQGYDTLSAHPYERGFWNRATMHPRYGFQRSLFRREIGQGPVVGWGLADGVFFRRLLERLRELDRPFFAFGITLSLHHPYPPVPAELSDLDVGSLEGTPLGNYLRGMNYFDKSMARLIADLDRGGLLDETVLVVYGDHDARLPTDAAFLELIGEHELDPTLATRLETVPLFVRLPHASRHGRVEAVGGQIDIAPTVLHYLGVFAPPAFVGRPLWAGGDGFAALPDGSAAGDGRLYVARGAAVPREGACFDQTRHTSLPRSACDELVARAQQEVEHSRLVLEWNLFPALRGFPVGQAEVD